MEINPSKSKIMHVGRNNPGLSYTIDGIPIDSVEVEKDIGFWISDDLSSSTHVHKARGRALGEISRIRRNFTFIDERASITREYGHTWITTMIDIMITSSGASKGHWHAL